jgi:hypothetical protein
MKKLLILLILLIISCDKDQDYITDFPKKNNTFKVSELSRHLRFPYFSKNGKFYGGENFIYNENNILTEYDFKKAEILIGTTPFIPLLECISNDGIPYYQDSQKTSFYFDKAKEPYILGKDIQFTIGDVNKDGIACGGSYPNGGKDVFAAIINTRNNKSLILSNPYSVAEIAQFITDPINKIFNVYGKSSIPEDGGRPKLCKWEIMINEDGSMKEKSKTIIGNEEEYIDMLNYNNGSVYGSINKHFFKLDENNNQHIYEDNNIFPPSYSKKESLTNVINLNNTQYGVGSVGDYLQPGNNNVSIFINFKTKQVTSIKDFVKDSLVISKEEKILLESSDGGFYHKANQQGTSIIFTGNKTIKLDLITR